MQIRVNEDQLEVEVVNLICFLIVSARGLMDEPRIYGPMRLMEATQRLIKLAEHCGIRSELVTGVEERIKAFPLDSLPEGKEKFVEFMDDLVVFLAVWVEQIDWVPQDGGEGC